MSNENSETDEMRNALSAIANEIQTLQKQAGTTNECYDAEILNKLIKYKCAINVRNHQIQHLKSNLKTACAVAKTISSAKTAELASVTKLFDYARNQYFDLEKQQSEKNEIINILSKENRALRDQFEFFSSAIQLCYQQLQGMRNERVENVSALEQLKYIIVCCGQYHADHSNEHERCIRLQQKNRFLSTKMIIMENNLEAARDELRNLRTCIKPDKEKSDALTRSRRVGVVCSEYKLGAHQKNFTKLKMTKIELTKCSSLANIRELDLTTHLKAVKKLLKDHDNLINDLKCLSRLINIDKTYWTMGG